MSENLKLIKIGNSERLTRALMFATKDVNVTMCPSDSVQNLKQSRIIFACFVDEWGMSEDLCHFLRIIRQTKDCLCGSVAGIVIDGSSELYTKQVAQEIALAASMSGCVFPGKALVEGTGSLYNQHILATRLQLEWENTYFFRIQALVKEIISFAEPKHKTPKILVIHASDNRRSNTMWIGHEIVSKLPENFSVQEISLQNGTIHDCRGCSFEACLHYAQQGSCFYGGAISNEVLPAIRNCDAMLFLCPNYNDAVSANIMALFNRMTNLLVQQELSDKYLFGVVVSGYSGSDIVARQLLGTMCFNKTVILPSNFCFIETAHDAGSAQKIPQIEERITLFTEHIIDVLTKKGSGL